MFTNNSGLMMTWFLCFTFLSCFLLRKPGERWQTSKYSIQHVPETLFQEHKAWSSILAGAGVREEGVTSIFPHPLAPSCLTHLPTSEGSLLFHKDFLIPKSWSLRRGTSFVFAFFWLCQVLAVGSLLRCLDSQIVVQGSVVVARGLSCSKACGILDPRPGIKPTSSALEDRFLTTGPPGKPQLFCFLNS